MTDSEAATPRPKPQYGEYATPEEQRRRIQQPDATWALETGQTIEDPSAAASAGTPAAPGTGSAPRTAYAPVAPAGGSGPALAGPGVDPDGRPRRRLGDRIATFALLGYGLVNVVISAPAMFDFAAYANRMFEIAGTGAEYTGGSAGDPWGATAAIVLIGGWLLTAWLSWRRMASGRLTWWIPLVGGVVFTLIASVLLVVPLVSDPGVLSSLLDQS